MNRNEYEAGDVLISIGGNHMCRIESVDVETGFYLCVWISYFGWKDCCRFGNIDPYFVKVDEWDDENKRMKGVEDV